MVDNIRMMNINYRKKMNHEIAYVSQAYKKHTLSFMASESNIDWQVIVCEIETETRIGGYCYYSGLWWSSYVCFVGGSIDREAEGAKTRDRPKRTVWRK